MFAPSAPELNASPKGNLFFPVAANYRGDNWDWDDADAVDLAESTRQFELKKTERRLKKRKGKKTSQELNHVVVFPICADTEFQTYKKGIEMSGKSGKEQASKTILMQAAHYLDDVQKDAIAIEHWDMEGHIPLAPRVKTNSVFTDYLKYRGYDAEIYQPQTPQDFAALKGNNNSQVIHIQLYGHFLTADWYRLFHPSFSPIWDEMINNGYSKTKKDDEGNATIKKHPEGNCIVQKRRLELNFYDKYNTRGTGYIEPELILKIGKTRYKVRISCIDTSGLMGIASYGDLLTNCGLSALVKESISSDEKANMLETYRKRTADVIRYGLNDLRFREILRRYIQLYRHEVCASLGIDLHDPALTVGSTCAQLMRGSLTRELRPHVDGQSLLYRQINKGKPTESGLRRYERGLVSHLSKKASADYLSRQPSTVALLGKVQGGRCNTSAALVHSLKGLIVDPDFSGAYMTVMCSLGYPVGNPFIFDYALNEPVDKMITIRELLTRKSLTINGKKAYFVEEKVDSMWAAVIDSGDKKLPYQQDYFASFDVPKKMTDIIANPDFYGDINYLERQGQSSILKHQIRNGILTEDGLEFINNIRDPKERGQYLNLRVKALAMYPKSLMHQSLEGFMRDVQARGNDPNYFGWYRFDFGDLIVSRLRDLRAKYKPLSATIKKKGNWDTEENRALIQQLTGLSVTDLQEQFKGFSKHPLENLFKLFCNVIYGASVSRYFETSNVIVAQNITGRCRHALYLKSKALGLFLEITDGGPFDLERVPYFVNASPKALVDLHHLDSEGRKEANIRFGQLWPNKLRWSETSEATLIETTPVGDKEWQISDFIKKLDQHIEGHIHQCFPWATVFDPANPHKIGIESKGIVKEMVSHGKANYRFRGGWHDGKVGADIIKMRSYKDRYGISQKFFNGLQGLHDERNKQARGKRKIQFDYLEFQDAYTKDEILKPGKFAAQYKTQYQYRLCRPGDTVLSVATFNPFSLARFNFQSIEQRKAWELANTKLKNRYSLSFEIFFLENQGKGCAYLKMMSRVYDLINSGCMDPIRALDTAKRKRMAHPSHTAKEFAREVWRRKFEMSAELLEERAKASQARKESERSFSLYGGEYECIENSMNYMSEAFQEFDVGPRESSILSNEEAAELLSGITMEMLDLDNFELPEEYR